MINMEKVKEHGSEWIKGGIRRFYFNDLSFAGLHIHYYGTGRVRAVIRDWTPDRISNSKGSAYIGVKVWYEVFAGELRSKGAPADLMEAVEKALSA